MAKDITITYSAVTAPSAQIGAQICGTYAPNNAAADLAPFDGTYYDTNVAGFGEGMTIETFFANSVAHPGLVLALKNAIKDGTYTFTTDDQDEIDYLGEVASAVADQGFEIEIEDHQDEP